MGPRAAWIGALSLVVAACQDGGTIELSPAETVIIGLDQQETVHPTVKNEKGRTLKATARDLSWSSSDPKIVTVDKDGVLTSVAYGSAEVTASLGTRSGTARVRVAKPARIAIDPPTADLIAAGPKLHFTAKVFDENDVELTTRLLTWSSKDKTIARVESGEVQGLNVGTTQLIARCGDALGEATVTVRYPVVGRLQLEESSFEMDIGDTLALPIYAYGKDGSPLRLVSLSYKSNKPKVATVDANGVVKARKPGSAVVTVSGSGQTAKANIRVFR